MLAQTNDFDCVANVNFSALDTSGSHRATSCDREHVFDRHQEWLIDIANGRRNVGIDGIHKVVNALEARIVHCGGRIGAGVQRIERGTRNDRNFVARETRTC